MSEINKERLNGMVALVVSQTNYNKDIALEKLKEWDYNYMNVIKEYLNPDFQKKKVEPKKTLNQRILGEIRHFMDDVNIKYEKRKAAQEYANQLLQHYNAQKEKIAQQEHNEYIEKAKDNIIITEKITS